MFRDFLFLLRVAIYRSFWFPSVAKVWHSIWKAPMEKAEMTQQELADAVGAQNHLNAPT